VALDQRLDEVEALASAGRWERIDAAVDAVVHAEARLVALRTPPAGGATPSEVSMPEHVDRLTALLAAAPDAEQPDLMRALAASGASPSEIHSNRDHQTANRGQRKGKHAVPVAPPASADSEPSASVEPTPAATPVPTAMPTDSGELDPSPTPRQHGGGNGNKDDKPPNDHGKGNGPTK
jgi:hypothetical protein